MIHLGMRGEYTLTRRKADTLEIVGESGIVPNLLTNIYLDRMGVGGDVSTYCCVGTSSTAPAFTDTQLGALLASTTNVIGNTTLAPTSPNWIAGRSLTYRFARGAAAGNLTEVGIGWATTSLASRALIVDSGGTPITFTVLSDEVLDITYTIYGHVQLTDSSYNVTIAGVVHTITARLAEAGSTTVWLESIPMYVKNAILRTNVTALGAVTGTTDGSDIFSSLSSGGITTDPYVNGSHQNTSLLSLSEAVANSVNGISGGVLNTHVGSALYLFASTQFMISPAIAKDNTKIASLSFNISWGRYP